MKQLNIFTEGIQSDIDVSFVKNTQWLFPTNNFRFFNKDGKGFIGSLLPSNEELFEIHDGYGILGVGVYGDIAYILSFNEASGLGEIGCYPSPADPVTGGFIRQYSALHNFNGGDFATALFNFDWEHPVDCLIRLSYDNSVDIYLCDYKNPNRTINCGFDIKTGVSLNTRSYKDSSFEGSINQFPVSSHIPNVLDAAVKDGGFLKPGNYYLYIQYMDVDYNVTAFMREIGPLMVAQGNYAGTFTGLQEKDWLRDVQNSTNKKITLSLNNLDTNYKYLQVGVVRYTDAQENGPAYKDVYLVDKYYFIEAGAMTIEISGNESEKVLTFEDVLNPVVEFDVCRSQIQLMNYWLGATWKKSDPDYDPLVFRDFAQRIVIGESDDFTTLDRPWPTIQDYDSWGSMRLQTYQDSANVYSSVAYFKGQIYPFAAKLILRGGKETEAFPLSGRGDPDVDGIYKGLFKFRTWREIHQMSGHYHTQKILSKVTFDCQSACNYRLANADKFKDVIAVVFMRGPRIENLIGQGVMMRGFWGMKIHGYNPSSWDGEYGFQDDVEYVSGSGGYGSGHDPQTAGIIPLFQGNLPTGRYTNNNPGQSGEHSFYEFSNEHGHTGVGGSGVTQQSLPTDQQFFADDNKESWKMKHGLFSPDILFDNDPVIPPDACIEPIFQFTDLEMLNNVLETRAAPKYHCIDLNEDKMAGCLSLSAPATYQAQAALVEKGQYKGMYNFSARLTDGDIGHGISIDSGGFKNRDIGTCRYVGIVDTSSDKKFRSLYGSIAGPQLSIVNLYRVTNDDAFFDLSRSSFDTRVCLYSPVSDPIGIASIDNTSYSITCCKGDCFLQKSWFRTHRWYDIQTHANNSQGDTSSDWGSGFLDDHGIMYQYGLMMSMITENRINAEARNEVVAQDTILNYVRYTFYPRSLSYGPDIRHWVLVDPGQFAHEAIQVNAGYNQVMSQRVSIGFDSTKIFYRREEQNRVYPSGKDSYRSLLKNSYQDYSKEDGYITSLRLILSHPYLVQEYAINQIFFAERMTAQTQDANDVIIGNSISILGDIVRKIADFGSQHKSSMVTGDKGDYGFDYRRQVWWQVVPTTLQSGSSMLTCKNLIEENIVEKEFNDYIKGASSNPDIISIPRDNPLKGSGIIGFFDPEFKEIGMTFLLTKEGADNIRMDRTFIYDEKIGKFKGNYPFAEPLYFNLGNMLLSVQHRLESIHGPQDMPDNPVQEFTINNKVWRYNSRSGSHGKFFGILQPANITIVVNGFAKEQGSEKVYKMFTGMEIEAKDIPLLNVIYETMYQGGTFDFADPRKSLKPSYDSHRWIFPVMNQVSAESSRFQPKSEMQGLWMKITITYKIEQDPEIRSIATNFDLIPEV